MPLFVRPMGGTTCCPWTTHFSIVLLLLLSMMASDTASQKTVGIGKYTLDSNGKVAIPENAKTAENGYKEADGKSTGGCPVAISETGSITITYTKEKGGKNGCGLDLIMLRKTDDYFNIEFEVAPLGGIEKCVRFTNVKELLKDKHMWYEDLWNWLGGSVRELKPDELQPVDKDNVFYSTYWNMLPFVYGLDNDEFERLNKGNGLQDTDKLCSKSGGSQPGKCKDGKKYRCRSHTFFEIGWSQFVSPGRAAEMVFLKPSGEFRRRNKGGAENQGFVLRYGDAKKRAIHQVTVRVASDKEIQIKDADISAHVKSAPSEASNVPFDCAASPNFYPFKTWKIREGGFKGNDFLFFGLLAQNQKRDHIDVGVSGMTTNMKDSMVPECGFRVTFSGSQFKLVKGTGAPPPDGKTTPIDPTRVTGPQPSGGPIVTGNGEETTPEEGGGGSSTVYVIVAVVVVLLLIIGGVVAYFVFFGGKEEEGEESGSEMGTKKTTTMGQTTGFPTADFTTAKSKTGYMTGITGKTTTAMTGAGVGGKTTTKPEKTYKTAMTGKTTVITKTKGATTTKPTTVATKATATKPTTTAATKATTTKPTTTKK